ncbi:MAG: hypothetical protein WC674_03890, partial [Candidatus Krumholzibacteriia bacterium]
GPFLYSNSLKRGGMDKRQDFYFSLSTKSSEGRSFLHNGKRNNQDPRLREEECKRALPYIQVAAHGSSGSGSDSSIPKAEFIRESASRFAPSPIHYCLQRLTQKEIEAATRDASVNKRSYQTLCYLFLEMVLSRDGWKLFPRLESCIEPSAFGENHIEFKKWKMPPPADFFRFLATSGNRKMLFFFDDEDEGRLSEAFKSISKKDGNRFAVLAVLVVRNRKDLQRWRHVNLAEKCPRTFFIAFEELREAAEVLCPDKYTKISALTGERLLLAEHYEKAKTISSFYAKVLSNTPVGGKDSLLYKLAFRAPQLRDARPSQFVMMDPMPLSARRRAGKEFEDKGTKRPSFMNPQPFLKRPFGIHRVIFKGFHRDYLKNLRLPPLLSVAMHSVYSEDFDILYKVLIPDGIGTKMMRNLAPDDLVHMIGPLGSPFNVRSLHASGIEEVHIIGGGVGMAPLVYFVQALRYFSFDVKAFIGIADIGSIKYRDPLEKTYTAEPKNAYAFIDDLLSTGLRAKDIFVSCDKRLPAKLRSIPRANLHLGFVSDQYESFAMRRASMPSSSHRAVMAIACGPEGMLQHVDRIASKNEIDLKVLLEKRMACGIGVCLS